VAVALGLTLVVFTLTGGRYWGWERIALGLAALNGLFLLAAIFGVGALIAGAALLTRGGSGPRGSRSARDRGWSL
jgi:hypothetical protein